MSALERLDAIDARANAATPGPWDIQPDLHADDASAYVGYYPDPDDTEVEAFDRRYEPFAAIDFRFDRDIEFVAKSREDVPVMATALRSVLALHVRHEPSGKCSGCWNHGPTAMYVPPWPCATVRIIETELAR